MKGIDLDAHEDRDAFLWIAVITRYGLKGRHDEALYEFDKIVRSGIMPNQSTFSSSLNSCYGLGALDRGKRQGFDLDLFVGNSLVVLYSKCGDLVDSLKITLAKALGTFTHPNMLADMYQRPKFLIQEFNFYIYFPPDDAPRWSRALLTQGEYMMRCIIT
ncbi:hypothetical protein IEQ34_003540 [Dendrobium chrysotoxum]|uniref:Pentatricopeptide repeat-containing protein n=1 Tax=Dendrobium chrysotoxum TaxID=161865 RepID=A0AAV7HHY9_DENCH|nr:hypothetical protein IEQ34_003540 [Dendrobium chrysotoxum]